MIKLKYVNKNILVYDLDHWILLRKTHRIMGHIIGNTGFIPSLPAKLLAEEAILLLDKGLAEVIESDNNFNGIHQNPAFEEHMLQAEQAEYRQVRKAQLEVLIDKIVAKRRELGDQRSQDEILNEELEKSTHISKENMLWPIFLHDKSSGLPVDKSDILALTNPLRTAVYKDLWESGYYVTSGEKFGGDFLVYLGDPICFHAIFIVKCVDSDRTISPTELVAFGRLGVSVKKRAVLASLQDGRVNYLTINWIDA